VQWLAPVNLATRDHGPILDLIWKRTTAKWAGGVAQMVKSSSIVRVRPWVQTPVLNKKKKGTYTNKNVKDSPGHKMWKNRLTLWLCGNAAGHMIKSQVLYRIHTLSQTNSILRDFIHVTFTTVYCPNYYLIIANPQLLCLIYKLKFNIHIEKTWCTDSIYRAQYYLWFQALLGVLNVSFDNKKDYCICIYHLKLEMGR
jgi:hypothetical protein